MAKLTKDLTEQETLAIYRDLQEYMNSLSFGYFTVDEGLKEQGADLAMLTRFFTPQDALYCMDMPKDDFFTVEWFAEEEGLGEEEAAEVLRDMCKRGVAYRELKEDGKVWYHNAPAAHGVFEFHAGDAMDAGWLGPLFATLGTGTLQACYDAGVPFYRALPLGPEVVKEGELLEDDDIFAMLEKRRRFCLSPCACLDAVRDNLGVHNCDHPKGVCLQCDEMADYYLDDLELGTEITREQAAAMLRQAGSKNLAIQTTYAKKNEVICQCNVCHCGILPALKNWPGDAAGAVTNYVIEYDADACVHCGDCAKRCAMQVIEMADGVPVISGTCIGCGVCVPNCSGKARILARKPETVEYPDTVWETYAIMEENRRAKGAL